MATTIEITQVRKAEVTFLVDNYTDLLLPDSETVKRMRTTPPNAPMAEHGLSYLVTVHTDNGRHTLLMDAGISGTCLNHNAALLPISIAAQFDVVEQRIEDVGAIVLSHGHFDHFGGLDTFLRRQERKMPLVVHPDAFVERRLNLGPGMQVPMPTLSEASLSAAGAVLDKRQAPSTMADGHILVCGQVARTTSFEKGTPSLEAKHGDNWQQDQFVDDQAIAFHLQDRGLVILGGCSHAGIINTIHHIRNVTGIDKVHAVLGGFHLSGAGEDLIAPTVQAMQEIAPQLVVPTHCTGWKAINAFAAAMPEQFVLNTVGTTYLFQGRA